MSEAQVITTNGFSFDWDDDKVHALDYPVIQLPITELAWHLLIPFWNSYTVRPIDVLIAPKLHYTSYMRIKRADTSFPIDVMMNDVNNKLTILDGLHRLSQIVWMPGITHCSVRKISISEIPNIAPSS